MDIKIGIDVLQCKFKQPTHNLTDARILPCGETVCFDCINMSIKTYNEKQLADEKSDEEPEVIVDENNNTNKKAVNKSELLLVASDAAVDKTTTTTTTNTISPVITNSSAAPEANAAAKQEDYLRLDTLKKLSNNTSNSDHTPSRMSFVCKFCGNVHDLNMCIENKIVNSIIKQNSIKSNLYKSNADLLKNLVIDIDLKKTQVSDFLNYKIPEIKYEIRNQVDFIKETLDEVEQEMQGQLDEIKDRIHKWEECFNFGSHLIFNFVVYLFMFLFLVN